MNSWISFDGVSFNYNEQSVFKDLSFNIPVSQGVLGIVGKSGVGKSTFLNLVSGYLRPVKGSISVHGKKVETMGAERPVVFQDHNLFPWMNLIDNVCFGLKAKGLRRRERYTAVQEILTHTGLLGHEHKLPSELSGGMQQRVGFARALSIEPDCILLDEPFGSLDVHTSSDIRHYFQRQLSEHHSNAVLVSHNLDEAITMCDAILLLQVNGKYRLIESIEKSSESQASQLAHLKELIAE